MENSLKTKEVCGELSEMVRLLRLLLRAAEVRSNGVVVMRIDTEAIRDVVTGSEVSVIDDVVTGLGVETIGDVVTGLGVETIGIVVTCSEVSAIGDVVISRERSGNGELVVIDEVTMGESDNYCENQLRDDPADGYRLLSDNSMGSRSRSMIFRRWILSNSGKESRNKEPKVESTSTLCSFYLIVSIEPCIHKLQTSSHECRYS